MTWSNWGKELAKGGLILLALALGFLLAMGILTFLRGSACDRLDAERISHLMPGHTTRGPDSIYVIGIEPGPPPSEIIEYWEAVAEMQRAGCDVPESDRVP